jgi:gamma-glutamylcyclotransferase (GGCT)/AIG2-like uncharacterized protein YtfP
MADQQGIDGEGLLVFFNGSVMRGQPHHENLAGAVFLRTMRTAPRYRLYSIGDRHPAMIATSEEDGHAFEGELYFVPGPVWPGIARTEPRGLYRGRVELSGGEVVHGMLGTPALIMTAGHDISEHLGWAAYIAAQTSS